MKVTLKKSQQAQRDMRSKVTQKMLDHELYRFTTMTDDQLKTRVKKLKNPVKAEAMRIMAKWCENYPLLRLARTRRNELVHG